MSISQVTYAGFPRITLLEALLPFFTTSRRCAAIEDGYPGCPCRRFLNCPDHQGYSDPQLDERMIESPHHFAHFQGPANGEDKCATHELLSFRLVSYLLRDGSSYLTDPKGRTLKSCIWHESSCPNCRDRIHWLELCDNHRDVKSFQGLRVTSDHIKVHRRVMQHRPYCKPEVFTPLWTKWHIPQRSEPSPPEAGTGGKVP